MTTLKITDTVTIAKANLSMFLFDNLKYSITNSSVALFVCSKTMNVSHRS